jgi:hypothetical protein
VVKVELTVWIGSMGEQKGERGAEPCRPPGSALEGYVACTTYKCDESKSIIIIIHKETL